MSAYQMTGYRYPNVGVMSASTAKKEIVQNFEYLNSFDKIILNFDNDEPGRKAAKDCAILFEPGKVCLLFLKKDGLKDANDYLKKGLAKAYISEWFDATSFMTDGIKLGSDPKLSEGILNYTDPRSIPYPWGGLNQKDRKRTR